METGQIKAKDLCIPFSQAGGILLLIIQFCPKNYITSSFQCLLLLLLPPILLLLFLHLLLLILLLLPLLLILLQPYSTLTLDLPVSRQMPFLSCSDSCFYAHIFQVHCYITFIWFFCSSSCRVTFH